MKLKQQKAAAIKTAKQRIDRSLFLKMLREAEKYSLLKRVASELYRAGFNSRRFFSLLHRDDWTLSNRILEELELIDNGRNGYDPAKVPPLLPVLVKYDTQETLREVRRGRPTQEQAKKAVNAWIQERLKNGWREVDLVNALREVMEPVEDAVVVVKTDPDLVEAEATTKTPRAGVRHQFHVCDGKDWHIVKSPAKARELKADIESKVLAEIRNSVPMDMRKATTCGVCQKALNGIVLTIRDSKGTVQDHLHPSCWWMHRAEPARIPLGMTWLNSTDGLLYRWEGAEKGGWLKVKDERNDPVPEKTVEAVPLATEAEGEGVVHKVL